MGQTIILLDDVNSSRLSAIEGEGDRGRTEREGDRGRTERERGKSGVEMRRRYSKKWVLTFRKRFVSGRNDESATL